MPDRQAAHATGSVLSVQHSLKRTCQRGPRQEGPTRRGGLSRHKPSVVHVGVSKLGEPRSCCPGAFVLVHLQEALTDPGVSTNGDDALDLRVVGQVAHFVLNVYAYVLAFDIEARSLEEIFNLGILKKCLMRCIPAVSRSKQPAAS